MSDEDRDDAPTGQSEGTEVTPASEDAYPSLELTQLTESERGGHDWFSDDE
jgi:hypothetical protein